MLSLDSGGFEQNSSHSEREHCDAALVLLWKQQSVTRVAFVKVYHPPIYLLLSSLFGKVHIVCCKYLTGFNQYGNATLCKYMKQQFIQWPIDGGFTEISDKTSNLSLEINSGYIFISSTVASIACLNILHVYRHCFILQPQLHPGFAVFVQI